MRRAFCLLVLFAGGSALLAIVNNAVAAEDAKPAPKATRLFDGKTLKGWNVISCEAEVQDGAMLLKPGEWNHFKLTVAGTRAELQINGNPAWKADGLEEETGYLGIQAEVPMGGQFLFKDILLTELGE